MGIEPIELLGSARARAVSSKSLGLRMPYLCMRAMARLHNEAVRIRSKCSYGLTHKAGRTALLSRPTIRPFAKMLPSE